MSDILTIWWFLTVWSFFETIWFIFMVYTWHLETFLTSFDIFLLLVWCITHFWHTWHSDTPDTSEMSNILTIWHLKNESVEVDTGVTGISFSIDLLYGNTCPLPSVVLWINTLLSVIICSLGVIKCLIRSKWMWHCDLII